MNVIENKLVCLSKSGTKRAILTQMTVKKQLLLIGEATRSFIRLY